MWNPRSVSILLAEVLLFVVSAILTLDCSGCYEYFFLILCPEFSVACRGFSLRLALLERTEEREVGRLGPSCQFFCCTFAILHGNEETLATIEEFVTLAITTLMG
jgi:hypothetical protein